MHFAINARITLDIDPASHEAELIRDDVDGFLAAIRAAPAEGVLTAIFGGRETDSDVSAEFHDLQIYAGPEA